MQKQRQSSSIVLRKRCSENMQQIYKRTPMPKCGFNSRFIKIAFRYTCFFCKFAAYFQNIFIKWHLWRMLMLVLLIIDWQNYIHWWLVWSLISECYYCLWLTRIIVLNKWQKLLNSGFHDFSLETFFIVKEDIHSRSISMFTYFTFARL